MSQLSWQGGLLPTAACYTLTLSRAGAAHDKATKDPVITVEEASDPDARVEAVKSGQRIEITLKDGRQLTGEFRGLVREGDPVYLSRYGAFASKAEVWLPHLGEQVRVSLSRMTFAQFLEASKLGSPLAPQDYSFRGFDYGTLVLVLVGSTHADRAGVGEIRMPVIEVADLTNLSGQRVSGDDIRRLMVTGGVPLRSAMAVETEAGSSVLALEDVDRIVVRTGRHGKLLGALFGVGADLAELSNLDGLVP